MNRLFTGFTIMVIFISGFSPVWDGERMDFFADAEAQSRYVTQVMNGYNANSLLQSRFGYSTGTLISGDEMFKRLQVKNGQVIKPSIVMGKGMRSFTASKNKVVRRPWRKGIFFPRKNRNDQRVSKGVMFGAMIGMFSGLAWLDPDKHRDAGLAAPLTFGMEAMLKVSATTVVGAIIGGMIDNKPPKVRVHVIDYEKHLAKPKNKEKSQ